MTWKKSSLFKNKISDPQNVSYSYRLANIFGDVTHEWEHNASKSSFPNLATTFPSSSSSSETRPELLSCQLKITTSSEDTLFRLICETIATAPTYITGAIIAKVSNTSCVSRVTLEFECPQFHTRLLLIGSNPLVLSLSFQRKKNPCYPISERLFEDLQIKIDRVLPSSPNLSQISQSIQPDGDITCETFYSSSPELYAQVLITDS